VSNEANDTARERDTQEFQKRAEAHKYATTYHESFVAELFALKKELQADIANEEIMGKYTSTLKMVDATGKVSRILSLRSKVLLPEQLQALETVYAYMNKNKPEKVTATPVALEDNPTTIAIVSRIQSALSAVALLDDSYSIAQLKEALYIRENASKTLELLLKQNNTKPQNPPKRI
jgi:uncharacterized protein YecA (UPF0149 family)